MAQLLGSIEPFDGDDFADYSERLDSYLFANKIGEVASDANEATKKAADYQKVATAISVIGKQAYKTLKDLCLPEKPTDKSYGQLKETLSNYYKPKVLEVAESYRFHHTVQGENETVIEYANKLKRLAVHCNFGPYLPRALRDQFVGGVRSQPTKKKLLSEDRTFEQTLKVAQADELAEKESKMLHSNAASIDPSPQDEPVHAVFHSKNKSQPAPTTSNASGKKCFRCESTQHLANKCNFANSTCHYCLKKGHISKACFKKKKDSEQNAQINLVTTTPTVEVQEDISSLQTVYMHSVNASNNSTLYKLTVKIDDNDVNMEIDTGSAVTLLNDTVFKKMGGNTSTLKPSTVLLKGYTGDIIKCFGEKEMSVKVGEQSHGLTIRVVEGPSLLGRDMMSKFTLPWHNIFNVVSTTSVDIIQQYPDLFENSSVGKLKGVQVSLKVKDENPVFVKPRVVPFAVRDQYEAALDKLEREDIIEKVEHSEWASPTVPVMKPDGGMRICGDYSVTINKYATLEQYPVPSLEELLSNLSGGKKFTKLDLSQAYHQLELTPESRKYTTINTHKGLYQYKRLTYGINSAVSIFQRTIENALRGLPGICVYIDDILITGETDEIHLKNLNAVLQRLQSLGLRLKKDKFHFMMHEIVYLGFSISAKGVAPTKEKVSAIQQAASPTSVAELQSFIGSANFLRKFVPDFAKIMYPLYQLLKKESQWKWGPSEQDAFNRIKRAMCADTVLRHYDPSGELVLQCDASSVGVGAVLLQPGPDGELQPVAYASRTLNKAEQNYSQIERESLAIVFGIIKFRQYLMGRHFKLLTDHKPLITLLGEHKPVPQLASARIKRWALLLAAYNYTIEFIPGKDNVHADFLSRKPVEAETSPEENVTVQVMFIEGEQIIDSNMVAMETKRDPILSKVLYFTKNGWPAHPGPEFFPYFSKRFELTHEDDILLWDSRVIIPSTLRAVLLADLHAEHLGMVKMKQLARRYLWWPKLDKEIEETVKLCSSCQESAKAPPSSKPAAWSWPGGPWKRLHLDFAGPYLGKMFLVIVDAYSKFIDIVPMSSATSATTIAALRHTFSYFGLPEHLVTDNGSQFTSAEFKKFLRDNCIHHTTTAPDHPATNGLAERHVGDFKDKLHKIGDTGESLQTRLDRYLLTYRATPTSLGKTPSELLMNRQPRLRLSALRSSHNKQNVKIFQDNLDNKPKYTLNQPVFVRNFGKGAKWVPGTIIGTISPRSFDIQVGDVVWKRHEEQIRSRYIPSEQCTKVPLANSSGSLLTKDVQELYREMFPATPIASTSPSETPSINGTFPPEVTPGDSLACGLPVVTPQDSLVSVPTTPPRRYPSRDRKPPDRFY